MKIQIVACLCLIFGGLVPAAVSADETWQGNAAVAVRGELDRAGYYAASNSFPPGTKILVTNLDNGKRVIVTVRQRLDGTANVFVLLSSTAAAELGMNPTDVSRIKCQVVGLSTDLTGGIDLVRNKDMDTNPSVGAPDLGKIQEDKTAPAEKTPSPSPSPSPAATPSPETTPPPVSLTTKQGRQPQKERFALPAAKEEADVRSLEKAPKKEKESIGDIALKEARVALKEKGEAVILSRPSATGEERGEEVVAILIEPKAAVKPASVGAVDDLDRPALPDRDTIEAALNDPMLQQKEKPFVYERHGVRPEREDAVLASENLPSVPGRERAEIDTYDKSAQELDRIALETHVLPEVREAEKGEVIPLAAVEAEKEKAALATAHEPETRRAEKGEVIPLATVEAEKERVALETFSLPQTTGPEKPDVIPRTDAAGKDKTGTDLALVPTGPKPPPKTTEPRPPVSEGGGGKANGSVTTTVWETPSSLVKNHFYLQLGVFKSRTAAEKIIESYPAYPVTILAGKSDNADVYKVVIGPLTRDESGTALYLFKARGYRDAFLRYIR